MKIIPSRNFVGGGNEPLPTDWDKLYSSFIHFVHIPVIVSSTLNVDALTSVRIVFRIMFRSKDAHLLVQDAKLSFSPLQTSSRRGFFVVPTRCSLTYCLKHCELTKMYLCHMYRNFNHKNWVQKLNTFIAITTNYVCGPTRNRPRSRRRTVNSS